MTTQTTVEPIRLTRQQVDTALDEVLAEVGRNHKLGNNMCLYFKRDANTGTIDSTKPVCIIGHMFAKLGITMEQLGAIDCGLNGLDQTVEYAAYRLNGNSIRWLSMEVRVVQFDSDRTRDFLAEVQRRQDENMPWGNAVDTARRNHPVLEASDE